MDKEGIVKLDVSPLPESENILGYSFEINSFFYIYFLIMGGAQNRKRRTCTSHIHKSILNTIFCQVLIPSLGCHISHSRCRRRGNRTGSEQGGTELPPEMKSALKFILVC